jgi:hypothetical protein
MTFLTTLQGNHTQRLITYLIQKETMMKLVDNLELITLPNMKYKKGHW